MVEVRVISASVAVVDQGLGINIEYHSLSGEAHKLLLYHLLRAAGFSNPRTVRFEKNKQGEEGRKIDWNRLRVSNDECQQGGIIRFDDPRLDLESAVRSLKRWMQGREPESMFGIRFDFGEVENEYSAKLPNSRSI